jgi:parallel beta-helix repeat protein
MATRPSSTLRPSLVLALASTISFAALTGCGDDETGSGGGGGGDATTAASGTPTSSSSSAASGTTTTGTGAGGGGGGAACGGADTAGCDVVIEPSDDDTTTIQEALIDDTDSGDVVCLCPGTYTLEREISLTVPDVTIQGVGETRDDVVLDFTEQTQDDDGIAVDSDGFTIQHLTVKNTPGNGIIVRETERVTFRDIVVTWDDDDVLENNGAYAIYPVSCSQVLVEDTLVIGAADAGIYVGQSTNIIVRNNVVHQNVAGIEIENSDDADVYENEAYDNTAGILVFVLPNLNKKDGVGTLVRDNDIHDNNRDNFAVEGTVVAAVPPGIGALVLAADATEFRGNTFTNNVSTSIVLVSYETIAALIDDDPQPDPDTDPYLSEVYIHDNTYDGNGEAPEQPFSFLGVTPVEDVVWDGAIPPKGAASICLSDEPPSFRNFNGVANIANTDAHETDTAGYECAEPVLDEQAEF